MAPVSTSVPLPVKLNAPLPPITPPRVAVTPGAALMVPPPWPSVTARVVWKALPVIASVPLVVVSPSVSTPVATPRLLSADTFSVLPPVMSVPPE
ncbi:hypothetical protein DP49_5701 [Burkholderia pseudomallei]|nr:hypothetical protein DP49_5701 [Burkholderia pseudomallei]